MTPPLYFMHLLSGLTVSIERDRTGGFFAVVPTLPGCGSQGETIREALENLDDALMGVLEVLNEDEPDRVQSLCGMRTASKTADLESGSTSLVEIEWASSLAA